MKSNFIEKLIDFMCIISDAHARLLEANWFSESIETVAVEAIEESMEIISELIECLENEYSDKCGYIGKYVLSGVHHNRLEVYLGCDTKYSNRKIIDCSQDLLRLFDKKMIS